MPQPPASLMDIADGAAHGTLGAMLDLIRSLAVENTTKIVLMSLDGLGRVAAAGDRASRSWRRPACRT